MTDQERHIRIVVDAMGGDYAPRNVVAGAVEALHESAGRFSITLVGKSDEIEAELRSLGVKPDLCDILHATEVIDMHDSPTAAVKSKKNSSIGLGLALHRDGGAQAFVSAGNTGAVMSASTLILGRCEGVGRPTIGAFIPTVHGKALLVDAGTNVDCRPRHLLEFGVMGSVFVSAMFGIAAPKVGLLNIGEEDTKGNDVSLEAFKLLKASRVNFIGNIEGRDVLKGAADVVVCDGFVGNILLKFGESVPSFFKEKFTTYASKSIRNKLVALVARSGMRSVMKELNYEEAGGVPLLGVNGVSIIGHGGSSPKAIKNMIFRAEEMALRGVNQRIAQEIKPYIGTT